MALTIHCESCSAESVARGVADLIDRHTNEQGRFCCARCGGTDTYLDVPRRAAARRTSDIWFRGIVPIDAKTRDATYAPFVFLTADESDGEISGIAFKYYRPEPSNGKKGKRGNGGGGGGPIMSQSQILSLVSRLVRIGVVSRTDWSAFIHNNDARAV
jgi:hypothetical protein